MPEIMENNVQVQNLIFRSYYTIESVTTHTPLTIDSFPTNMYVHKNSWYLYNWKWYINEVVKDVR